MSPVWGWQGFHLKLLYWNSVYRRPCSWETESLYAFPQSAPVTLRVSVWVALWPSLGDTGSHFIHLRYTSTVLGGKIKAARQVCFLTSDVLVLCSVPELRVLFLTGQRISYVALVSVSVIDNTAQGHLATFLFWYSRLEWRKLETEISPSCVHWGRHFWCAPISTLTCLLAPGGVTCLWPPLHLKSCDRHWQWAVRRAVCVPSDPEHSVLWQDRPAPTPEFCPFWGNIKKMYLHLSGQNDSPSNTLDIGDGVE